MSNSEIKYYQEDYTEIKIEEIENLSEDALNIIQLFRLLSSDDKVAVKKAIRQEYIF
jgi:hypothetical protein